MIKKRIKRGPVVCVCLGWDGSEIWTRERERRGRVREREGKEREREREIQTFGGRDGERMVRRGDLTEGKIIRGRISREEAGVREEEGARDLGQRKKGEGEGVSPLIVEYQSRAKASLI